MHHARFAPLLVASMALALLSSSVAAAQRGRVREIEIVVDGGYRPDRVTVREGERVRLRFVRRDASPCTRVVVFPGLGIRRELPRHRPVVVDLPALPVGEHALRCGMSMIRGTIVVRPR